MVGAPRVAEWRGHASLNVAAPLRSRTRMISRARSELDFAGFDNLVRWGILRRFGTTGVRPTAPGMSFEQERTGRGPISSIQDPF